MDIVLDHVCFQYGALTLLHDVNLRIAIGESVLVSGPSGSGKTTFLRVVGGVLRPTGGSIFFGGYPVSDKNRSEDFGFSFVDNEFFEEMNLEENIHIFPHLNNIPVDVHWYHELLEVFEMKSLVKKPISQLSAGQRERVGLMRALITKPKILILDEPGSHLDPDLQEKLGEFLREYQKKHHATLIVSSHGGLELSLFHIFLNFHENHTVSIHTNPHP